MDAPSPLAAGRGVVEVSYHQFHILVDQESILDPPHWSQDLVFSAGGGFAIINTGIADGPVNVTVEAWDSEPHATTAWEESHEIAVEAVPAPEECAPTPFEQRRAEMKVFALMAEADDLPVLNPGGPGRYHLRVSANGRDHSREVDYEPHEEYLIEVWPSPPGKD